MPTFKINDEKLAKEIAESHAKLAEKGPTTKTYTHSDVPRGKNKTKNPVAKSNQHVKTLDL